MLLSREYPSSTRITPSVGDGGVDILDLGVAADGGDVVYQVKRHTRPLTTAQQRRVEESLSRVLTDPRWKHRKITQWILVMPWDPTPEAERWLHTLGETYGVDARWRGLTFIDRMAAEHPRIVDAWLGSRTGHARHRWGALAGEIAQLSSRQVGSILGRLGGDGIPLLEFPSAETAGFLDRAGAAQRSGMVSLSGLDAHLANVKSRARAADVAGVLDAQAQLAHLVAPLSPLVHSDVHPLGEASTALERFEKRLADAMSENLKATKAQGARVDQAVGTDSEYQHRHRHERLVAYGKGLIALASFVRPIRVEVEAASRGAVLVTGRWGTGKSYQIARYAQREMDAGRPVLLLKARDFVDPVASIIGQRWWRGQLGAQDASDEDFLEALDAVGWWAEAPVTIAIDGLNESSLRDPAAALNRVAALVDRFQNVRLVVTDRQDRTRPSVVDLPTFRHVPPDRAVLSRSLEGALGVPPGTSWHAALTNPLLASIAARVVTAQPQTGSATDAGSLSRVALLNSWIAVLVGEASAQLGLPPATVRALIDAVAANGRACAVRCAAESSGITRETANVVLARFVEEGLLEWDASDADTVRFRWQGAGDMLVARIEMERQPRRGAVNLLQQASPENSPTVLDTIAETLPTLRRQPEIMDLRLPGVTAADRGIAFALSLGGRPDSQVTQKTEKYASALLKSGGVPSEEVLWSVLASPRRSKLGLRWLNDQLRGDALSSRSKYWPSSLEQLCDASPASRDALRALLTWYADQLRLEITETSEAADVIETLAWFSCASYHSDLPEFAVACIVELAHACPEALAVAGERLKDVDDDHPRDAIFSAAAGVVSRWPASDAAAAAREFSARAVVAGIAKSLRSGSAIRQTLTDERPLHEFLKQVLPAPPRRAVMMTKVGMPSEDRAMFADARTHTQSAEFEARVWRSFSVPIRHTSRVMAGRRNFAVLPEDTHGGALLRGRWLAHQYANHPAGSRLWLGAHGHAKAGTPLNPGAEYAEHTEQVWDSWVDPTLPLELTIRTSDRVSEQTWWTLDGAVPTVIVTDPDGVSWIVLHGGFRSLEPDLTADGDRRSVSVGSGGWWSNRDEGTPATGLVRHDYVDISHAQLADTDDNDVDPFENGSRRFGDLFCAYDSKPGALLHPALGRSMHLPPPTATLLRLLNATWTGEGVDCRDATGMLVVTNPATGTGLPRAVLVRRDALEAALNRTSRRITVEVRVTDNHSSQPFHDAPTFVVEIGDPR